MDFSGLMGRCFSFGGEGRGVWSDSGRLVEEWGAEVDADEMMNWMMEEAGE